MGLHDPELVGRQPAGLHEDRVRDADLPYVMEGRGPPDQGHALHGEAKLLGEQPG